MGQLKTKPKRTKRVLKSLRGDFVEVSHGGKRIRRKQHNAFVENRKARPGSTARINVFSFVVIDGTKYTLDFLHLAMRR